MKIFIGIFFIVLSLVADIRTTVQNNGVQIHLVEKGQSFMFFIPQPKEVLHLNESNFFTR